MSAKIILPVIVVVAILATCLEGRYHLEETGLRHHRHDRHHQAWEKDESPEATRRRDWDDEDAEDEVEYRHGEKNAIPSGRRNPYERRGASYRGRNEPQRKWRSRSEGRHGRDHPATSWRWGFEGVKARREPGRHVAPVSGRPERPWTYRNPTRYGRRRDDRRWGWYDDEEDEGYDADDENDDENEAYSSSRKHVGSKSRRNRYDEWRRRVDDEEYEEDDDAEEYDYEDYDTEETKKRPSRRKHGKRDDDFDEEFDTGKKRESPGGKKDKKNREKAEDFNEVEDDDDDYGDAWDNEEDFDDDVYDETEKHGFESANGKGKKKTNLNTLDDIIRTFTGRDATTPKSPGRRDYRDTDVDKQTKSSPKLQSSRTPKKTKPVAKTLTTTTTTTTTAKPESYVKYTNELNRVTNSSKKYVETVANKNLKKSNVEVIDSKKSLLTRLTETDPDAMMTSLEQQDYEEYENDGIEKSEDMENSESENDRKNRDYNDDENENDDEIDRRPPTTTTTTPLPTTTTTTTTTTSPISARSFDRHSRTGSNTWRNSPTTSTPYPQMSNYSASKWLTLGSRSAVNEQRQGVRREDNSDIRLAIDHAKKMLREAACRSPKPKVIPVHDVYTTPSKTYTPSCTILHRCADDTGCCRSDETCVPKHSHHVELSFYASQIGSHPKVEKLKFENHTECYCRLRSELRTTSKPIVLPKPCRCPSNFTSKVTPDGLCQCTCLENRHHCIRERRGKEILSHADRWCIHSGKCTSPSCEFGEYIKKYGRCPKKIESSS